MSGWNGSTGTIDLDKIRVGSAPSPRAMTEAEVMAAARDDPDARPWTDEQRRQARPVPQTRILRWSLPLTEVAFAVRYDIPLGTLRDREQGRFEPDMTARAYLMAIAGDPAGVAKVLSATQAATAAE